MPVSSKKAQVTTSAPTVNTAQPRIRPAKRAKKSKVNPEVKVNDAEWHFPIFYRSLSSDDPATKETEETADDGPESVNECELRNSERCKAAKPSIRKRPEFEETRRHLFGPSDAQPESRRRRDWEMDTYSALFGPDGQMMMSKYPRHYDIFDMKIRKRKQQEENTHSNLFGDSSLRRPCSATAVDTTHDRPFGGDNLESSESQSPAQTSSTCKHWDVFEPLRGMRRRRQKLRCDADDTHGELFPTVQELTVRESVENPPRYTKKTPKIVKDVVYQHLQPLLTGDPLPPLRTGKAFPKPNDPPRNPLTGGGYAALSRNSIVMPERQRVLKAAAEGVTVLDPHDRNPITGDGMPVPSALIVQSGGRQQRRPGTASGAFTSQFAITDEPFATAAQSDSDTRVKFKQSCDAHVRMFDNPRNPVFGESQSMNPYADQQPASNAHVFLFDNPRNPITAVYTEPGTPAVKPLCEQHQRLLAETSVFDDEVVRFIRKRHVQPVYRQSRHEVLAWGKLNGNIDDKACFVADPPMIRRNAVARDDDPASSPIISNIAQPTAIQSVSHVSAAVVDRGEPVVLPPNDVDYYCVDDDDNVYYDVDDCEEEVDFHSVDPDDGAPADSQQ